MYQKTIKNLVKDIKMKNYESILSHNVKEKIIKAAREGKDLNDRVSEITMNAVKMASEATDKTIENIEEISWQVAEGAAQAAKELGHETDTFVENAINGIKRAIEQIQPETSESFYQMFETISDQIKETAAKSLETVNDEIKKLSKSAKDIFLRK